MPFLRTVTRFAAAAAVSLGVTISTAMAADKITFLTSWFAQAEHGGFYQAKAAGLYEKAGLDVTIRMGGPQVNGLQLMLAGEADIMMSHDLLVLRSLERGIPLVTVATSFQKELQGLMTHAHVKGLDDLKDKTILVATSGRGTWWPWMRARFGYTDAQTQPYTFNLQPFFADKNVVQQAYPSSEPFQAQLKGLPANFFLFADNGYPPYGTTMVTSRKFLDGNRDAVRRFVQATLEGWKMYLTGDPTPGNTLIKADNPKMSDAQIAFAIKRLNELQVFDGGDAKSMGVGIMTAARWQATHDFMVKEGLLKGPVKWQEAFTDEFVKDLKITTAR